MDPKKRKRLLREWSEVKIELDKINTHRLPKFSEGEIWWTAVGQNVGHEIFGKSKKFSRPVLIFSKLDRYTFLAIPLSTKYKHGTWYVQYNFRGQVRTAVVAQIRVLSVNRLYQKIGQMDERDMRNIAVGLFRLLFSHYTESACPDKKFALSVVAEGRGKSPNVSSIIAQVGRIVKGFLRKVSGKECF